MLDFTIPFKVVLEVILFQLIFKTKKFLKPMLVVFCAVVIVLGVVLFLDQMQIEPKQIVTTPVILKDEEPERERLDPRVSVKDPASILDQPTFIVQRSNGVIQTQEVVEDGSTKISYKIKNGSTLFYLVQI